jgi:mRNA interferase RelE/StbE
MSFRVVFSSKSCKTIKSFDQEFKERIKKAIQALGDDPWKKGTIKVKGHKDVRRKRVGDYRIIYRIDQERGEILVALISKRDEETYKF